MTYETNVDLMLSDLKSAITGIIANTYIGYYAEVASYPACWLSLDKDAMKTIVNLTDHTLIFDLLILFRGGSDTPEKDMNDVTSLVGSVWDALELKRVKTPSWRDLTVKLIDFTFNRSKSLIFYVTHLSVEILARW